MTFTDPQGRTLTVNSPDGSIPSESELDQMFAMKYGNVANPNTLPVINMLKNVAQAGQASVDWSNRPLTGGAIQKFAENNQDHISNMPQPQSRPFDSAVEQARNTLPLEIINKAGASTLGEVADLATSPSALAFSVAKPLVSGVQSLQRGAGNAIQFFKNLVTGPEDAIATANAAKFQLNQQTAQQIADAQRIGKAKIGIAQDNASVVSQGYDDLATTLQKQVTKAADKQGLEIQSNLPKIFSQKSQEYANEQAGIIQSLPETQRAIPADNVVKGMESGLTKFGILRDEEGRLVPARTTFTPTEQQVLNLYNSTKSQLESNPGATIDIEDLMKTQKYLEPQYGQAWTPDDKLRSIISENIANNVSNAAPALQKLKTQYAPFLKWKQAAIDKLQPFNSKYDVATGTLAKSGSSQISPAEQRLMAKLQEYYESPNQSRINTLNKGIQQTAMNKAKAAQAAKDTIQNLRNNLAKDLQQIRQNRMLGSQNIEAIKNQLIKKYTIQRIGVGAVATIGGGLILPGIGKALEYFIRRHVSNGNNG